MIMVGDYGNYGWLWLMIMEIMDDYDLWLWFTTKNPIKLVVMDGGWWLWVVRIRFTIIMDDG